MKKKTLIIGASSNPERYAYRAFKALTTHGHPVELVGVKSADLDGQQIKTLWSELDLQNLDTVTLYVGPKNQEEYISKIIELRPNRVIFNPGTENSEFYKALKENQIFYEEACTLVLLNINQY